MQTASPDQVREHDRDGHPQPEVLKSTEIAPAYSILFSSLGFGVVEETRNAPPEFFHDLNLDQIVNAITQGRDEYNLKPFFHAPLKSVSAIAYRQAIMRDLEREQLAAAIASFSEQMRKMRSELAAAQAWQYRYAGERWQLEAAGTYCQAVTSLRSDLERGGPASEGLKDFSGFLGRLVESDRFRDLQQSVAAVKAGLAAIRYTVLIKGGRVTVQPYESEIDYTVVVENTFARFKQGVVKSYLVQPATYLGMNHVEAAILERVAWLNAEPFRALDEFCAQYSHFLDETVARFDREVQFYAAYLEYMEKFRRAGLSFCYPQVSTTNKELSSRGHFDLALADKLLKENSPVVCNDFSLTGRERIFVVTGPNQGGKTTFARTFGQLHYLASLGVPVPGSQAQLFLPDQIFTHFEREEDITTLRGKMQDDLVRIHHVLEHATANSLVIINEIFSSTSLKDGVQCGKKVMAQLLQLNLLGVCVTFLDELASLDEKIVSVVAAIEPENPSGRTYKIVRRPADGLAYALALAEKYHLTYGRLKERLKG